MLRIENVSKSYNSVVVLQPTTLEVAAGRTLALIGPSGCGKSTLLKLIVGLISRDSGDIYIDQEQLCDANVQQLRHRIGLVLQEGGLFPHLTARQNVTLMARYLRYLNEPQLVERTAELAELTNLPHELLDRYPNQLSGGQRQRVAMMRGLMLDPPLLLLDEPMGALDPLIRYGLQEDLQEIFAKLGKTVLLVTHDLSEAAFLGQEVALMSEGSIIQRGTLEDFRSHPESEFVERFVTAQRGRFD